ncbi:MAG TPA: YciI family protein [Gemmatimonadales bacterium]|nr:YciI family protein [Gemmatimonadales bacterium]
MHDYLLLLHESPAETARLSPTEMQALVERYVAWSQAIASQGRMVSGHKLRDEGGRIVRRAAGRTTVTDGPFIEAKEIVGGFFVVRAASYEEAVALAESCPHTEIGWIEVRAIEATDA